MDVPPRGPERTWAAVSLVVESSAVFLVLFKVKPMHVLPRGEPESLLTSLLGHFPFCDFSGTFYFSRAPLCGSPAGKLRLYLPCSVLSVTLPVFCAK